MIDLSADLGEGAPGEEEIWPLITSANVACGGHVGNERSMREAAEHAAQFGVRLGAHPSYPDRQNFGRTSVAMSADALRHSIAAQIEALRSVAAVYHVKPHGALYNDAHRDAVLAAVIVEAIQKVDQHLAIVCSSTSQMAAVAWKRGVRVIREAFADRRYEPDGSLTPRAISGALLTVEEAASQAAMLVAEGMVVARDGSRAIIEFDTICTHADMEHATARLRAIRDTLAGLSS